MRIAVAAGVLLLTAHLAAGVQTPAPGSEPADWVSRQVEARDTGRDGRFQMAMRLFDRQGRVRERALTVTTLRGRNGAGDRVLVRFSAPNDIKGTGFLVWEHDGADDERFLFLPALGRVRRIAGSEKQDSFVGSDLSYEDIGGRDIADYTYAFVERNATWTAPDGSRHAAWQLESRAIDRSAAYPRTVSLVRKDNFVVVGADAYNRRDEREKRYEVRRLERVAGIWTALEAVMVNDVQKTRTELTISKAEYNVGLGEADFSRRALEQGAR
jgi:hypothetical protein